MTQTSFYFFCLFLYTVSTSAKFPSLENFSAFVPGIHDKSKTQQCLEITETALSWTVPIRQKTMETDTRMAITHPSVKARLDCLQNCGVQSVSALKGAETQLSMQIISYTGKCTCSNACSTHQFHTLGCLSDSQLQRRLLWQTLRFCWTEKCSKLNKGMTE